MEHRQSVLPGAQLGSGWLGTDGDTSGRKDDSEGCGGVCVLILCSSAPEMHLGCPGKFHKLCAKPCLRRRRSSVHLPKTHLTELLKTKYTLDFSC